MADIFDELIAAQPPLPGGGPPLIFAPQAEGAPIYPRAIAVNPIDQAIANIMRGESDVIEPGNIDVTKQPIVRNPDGTVSTVKSFSREIDGQEVLLPTITPEGEKISQDEAVDRYKRTGEHLGKFRSSEAADAFAEALHESEDQRTKGDIFDQLAKGEEAAKAQAREYAARPEVQATLAMPEGTPYEVQQLVKGGYTPEQAWAIYKEKAPAAPPPTTAMDEIMGAIQSVAPGITSLQESLLPLPRPVPQAPSISDQPTLGGKLTAAEAQILGALWNTPSNLWNFATSPEGLAIAAGAEAAPAVAGARLAPLINRAIAAGFTLDMIKSGLQAGTLQEGVEAALGTALGAHGALHPGARVEARERTAAELEPIAPEAPAPPRDIFDELTKEKPPPPPAEAPPPPPAPPATEEAPPQAPPPPTEEAPPTLEIKPQDLVTFKTDEAAGVGTIIKALPEDQFEVRDQDGQTHTVDRDEITGRHGELFEPPAPTEEAPPPAEAPPPGAEPSHTAESVTAIFDAKKERDLPNEELQSMAQSLDVQSKPLYDQLNQIPEDKIYVGKSLRYTPEYQAIHDQIKPIAAAREQITRELERRRVEELNQKTFAEQETRVKGLPVFQRRNGWEIVKDEAHGQKYVVRDPFTGEEVYRHQNLKRAREVADESAPEKAQRPFVTAAGKERSPLAQDIAAMGVPYEVQDQMHTLSANDQRKQYGASYAQLIEAVATAPEGEKPKLPEDFKIPEAPKAAPEVKPSVPTEPTTRPAAPSREEIGPRAAQPPTKPVEAGPKATEAAEKVTKAPETSPKKMKVQKAYLVDALDKAAKEAPETATSPQHEAELETVEGYRSGASLAQGVADAEALAKKYGVDTRATRSEVAYELRKKIEAARHEALPKIEIEVPGDGTFTIVNSKEGIKEVRDRVRKGFPVTAAPAGVPKITGRLTETPVTPLGKGAKTREDAIKIAGAAASKDETRAPLFKKVFSTGDKMVGTDGRRMIIMDQEGPKDTIFDVNTKKKVTHEVDEKGEKTKLTYPNWKQVVPQKGDQKKYAKVDTDALMKLVNQAKQMVGERANSVKIFIDNKGKLGVTAYNPEVGEFRGGEADPNTSQFLVALNPDFLLDGLRIARQLGHEKVDLLLDKKTPEMSPVTLDAKGMQYIQMPMRISGEAGAYTAYREGEHPLTKTAPPPETPPPEPPQKSVQEIWQEQYDRQLTRPDSHAPADAARTGYMLGKTPQEVYNDLIKAGVAPHNAEYAVKAGDRSWRDFTPTPEPTDTAPPPERPEPAPAPPADTETKMPGPSAISQLTDYHIARGETPIDARAKAMRSITEGHESDQAGLEYHDEFIKQGRGSEPFYTAEGQPVTHNEAAQLFREKVAAPREVEEARPGEKGTTYASPEPPVLGMEREREAAVPDPADDPNFTALPVDLPEAVRFSNELLNAAISVKKKLKALGGRAAGVFRYGAGKPAEIHLRADIADLLDPREKAQLRAEAEDYAARMARDPREAANIAQQRYEYLLDKAYEEAKQKPPLRALKVIWHEIGHAVDYMEHAAEIKGVTPREVKGRGNLFGHIAALHKYLKEVISLDPTKPAGKPITPKESKKLFKEAEKQMQQQVGPMGETVETLLVEEPILRVTGITPADVKNLFGMEARETLPELYKWFAEQTAEVKKEIVRKAMRGLLDERLAALGKTEKIGTRTVEKTIRKRVGREPTTQEITERFRELFREELKRRNLAQLDVVKGELQRSIAWWHGTEKMPGYFSTPTEMYAEAFSIFMNNPSALARRAPTYSRLIWNYMDHRPEVAAIYDKLQNEIKSGQVKDRTEAAMLDSWDEADKKSLEQAQKRQTTGTMKDFLDNVSYHMDRRFGPLYRAAKGATNEGALRAAIGNFLYRASEHELILNRLNREVSEPLVKESLDWKDLGRYMFYKRVAEERYKIFNPFGIAPDRALNRLVNMRETMGERRFAALEAAQQKFRQIYEERVLDPMRAERMWSPELQEAIDRNVFYSTFDVRQTAEGAEDGIARLLKLRYGDSISPHIYRQIGTVKEIKNPATATVLKALSLTSSTIRNTLKREATQALLSNDPSGIMEARKRWTGRNWEYVPVDSGNVGTVVFMKDGKPQAYYVRKVLADSLNKGSPIQNRLTLAAVRATGALKGLLTQLNYGFWPVNFLRDTAGWITQLPGATPLAWAREFGPAFKAARASIKGRANPYADDVLRRRMVISRADPAGVWSAAENEYEAKVASYGLNPASWDKESKQVNTFVKAWNSYREFGQAIERTNKIAAMNYLDRAHADMPEWKKAEIVRERGGSPDFLQRGASNPYVDFFGMFYNPWKEAIRSVSRSARENPWSFAAKTTAFVAAPTMMQAVAASGGLGKDMEDQYRSIPDYDLSNYLCIPMGWADKSQNKVAYMRLPLWEPARILHMALWGMSTGRGDSLLSIYGGTLPSMNAMLNVATMWTQHELFGKNPYDSFRGKNVLTDDQFKAGGWDARKELLKYSWNALGGPLLYRFQNAQLDNPSTTKMEDFLQLPVVSNALGRWFKVSNKGIDDMDRTITKPQEQQRAQTRLAVQEIERKMTNNEQLTANERTLMRDPYAMQYLAETLGDRVLKQQSPLMRRLLGKPEEEQMAILQNELARP